MLFRSLPEPLQNRISGAPVSCLPGKLRKYYLTHFSDHLSVTFVVELLPENSVWSRSSCINHELKVIFEENKQGFEE